VCEGKTIGAADLMVSRSPVSRRLPDECRSSFAEGMTLKDLEEEYIEHVYKKTNGSIKECSAILGIDRTTLWRRIKEKPR
jgi:transcriptional regulator of acetoin/glycerol metabolism